MAGKEKFLSWCQNKWMDDDKTTIRQRMRDLSSTTGKAWLSTNSTKGYNVPLKSLLKIKTSKLKRKFKMFMC